MLRFAQDPTLGGWSGRLGASAAAPNYYVAQADLNPYTNRADRSYVIIRWHADIERDFAARADWGITRRFTDANHAPLVRVGDDTATARPGTTVKLHSTVVDPDGDRVDRAWTVYKEASSVATAPAIRVVGTGRDPVAQNAFVTVPADAKTGQRLVLVLSATDTGTPSLPR